MKVLSRVLALILILAVVSVFFLVELKQRGLDYGFPLDDSWIHYVFANNIANGDFFTYNPGERVMGSSSPLWVFLLVPAFLFSSSMGFHIWWGLVLGLLFHLGCAIVLYLHFRMQDEVFAFLVACAVLVAGRLMWAALSGMETSLFCFLSLVSWLVAIGVKKGEAKPLWLGVLLALTVYARPEGYFLTAIFLPWIAFDIEDSRLRFRWRSALTVAGVVALLVLPYVITCLLTWGRLFPTTVYVRHQQMASGPLSEWLMMVGVMFIKDNFLTFLMTIVGVAFLLQRGKKATGYGIACVWILLLAVLQNYGSRLNYHHGRYQIPLIPFFIAVAAWAAIRLRDILENKDWSLGLLSGRAIPTAVFVAIVMVNAGDLPVWKNIYRENVKSIQWINVRTANYILEHVPPASVVAANDIGAIAYFGKHEVLDLMGIVSPDIYERTHNFGLKPFTRNYVRYVAGVIFERPEVQYVAVFPDWFPFEELYPDAFVLSYETYGPSIDDPSLEVKKRVYFIDKSRLSEYIKPR